MSKANILIVEDDAILAMDLQRMVSQQGYMVFDPLASGEEAIAFLVGNHVDLVLMDIELAGVMNGIRTAETLHQTSDIPVVFLTGFSSDPLLEQAKIAAPYGYLIKPVPERELAATLEMALHRHSLDRQLQKSRLELQKSEEKYRQLFEDSPLGIFRTTLEGKVLAVNAEMARIFDRVSPEEAIADFTHLADQFYVDPKRRQQFITQLKAKGAVQHFEFEGRKKNGETLWISMNARLTPTDAANGHSGEMVIDGFAIDITELKRKEKELQESEEKYRLLHESAGLGIGYYTPDGVVVSYNEIASRYMNGRPEDFTGRSIHDLFPKEAAFVYMDRIKKAINSEAPQVYEDRVELPTMITWYLSTFTRILDSSGTLLGVQIISNDISERKRAEESLRESENLFRSYFDLPLIGIAITSLDKGWIEVNQQLSNILGYSREELVALTWTELTHPDDLALDVANFEDVLAGKTEGYSMDKRFIRKDSTVVYAAISVRCVRRSDGMPDYFVALVQDITERKRAEEEKKMLSAQLQQAQKMESIGTLAGGIAHDFNNILGAILGYAELARDDSPAGSPVVRDIDQVIKASHRAKDLVKQILAFSRQAECEQILLQPAIVVKETLKMLRSSLPSTIAIHQNLAPDTGLILADPTQIHQIIMNLCTNAFHAMEETGGILSVTVEKRSLTGSDLVGHQHVKPGDFVHIAIGDTGRGIAPEIRDRIFDPFFTTKEVGKGTGMGLSIVHGIVKSYGGFVSCESQLGKGTVFHITLPTQTVDHPLTKAETIEILPIGNERILFVDDEPMLSEMAGSMLQKLGYHVTVRGSSLEALSSFQNEPNAYDLIITDQTMPGMAGIDMARRMLQIRPGMPIILCTGYSTLISEEKVKSLGIKGFAMKPLAKKDIAAIIRKVLDEEDR